MAAEGRLINSIIPVEFIVMLSQKARYALRALYVLAAKPAGATAMIAEIAAEARAPRKFLEQILLDLKKRGIVHSHRGKHGGYGLGRPAEQISFAEIIRAIDGPLALSPCVSVTAYRRCDDCPDETTCVTRNVLLAVRDATAEILENRTLAEALPTLPAAPKRGRHRTGSSPPA
jgi:Rrf2 family protein